MLRKKASKQQIRLLKTIVFNTCLIPFLLIIWDGFNDLLGADPIKTLHVRTGDWALRFLLITLLMSPLQRAFNVSLPIRFRRMFGLFAFFYASLHLAVWLVLDQSLRVEHMLEDIPESPYIMLGLLAYLMLIPLAITSTKGMMRRLGKRWVKLHRSLYLIAVMGVVHFFWLTKLDDTEPFIYAVLLAVLLLFRYLTNKKINKL